MSRASSPNPRPPEEERPDSASEPARADEGTPPEPPSRPAGFEQLLKNPRTRPTCLIAGLALLIMSLIYCGGLAAILLLERDPESGRLVPRFQIQRPPTPVATATPAPTPTTLLPTTAGRVVSTLTARALSRPENSLPQDSRRMAANSLRTCSPYAKIVSDRYVEMGECD